MKIEVGSIVVAKYAGLFDECEVLKVYENGTHYKLQITTPPHIGNIIVVEADRIVSPKIEPEPKKNFFKKLWFKLWSV
jgi:hypothetical protein